MPDASHLVDVPTIRKPNPSLVADLESLLEQARSGDLRGLLFVAYGTVTNGCDRYGLAGEYSLPEFAVGIKLMELELDSIITRAAETD